MAEVSFREIEHLISEEEKFIAEIERAKSEAEEIMGEAKRKAKAIVEDAKKTEFTDEVRKLEEVAKEHIEQIKRETDNKIAKIKKKLEEKREGILSKLISEILGGSV